MRYLSVCSGIEAATVAWHPLGWEAVAYSEIEKFPSQVLAHHYPNTPNVGDMTKFKEWTNVSDVDVLVGGTPCQSFSVAGLRKGLDDPRGNLMLTYLAIAAKYRPKWLVWENVPGVLSSNGGLDFASLLRGMGELGYGFAYRVLDAQYFGVAQRRRRVFVVGYVGNWRPAAAVLFERHSLCGYPAPSREAGKTIAPTIKASVGTGGVDVEHPMVAVCGQGGKDLAGTITAGFGGNKMGAPEVDAGLYIPVAHALTASRSSTQCPNEDTTLIPMISQPVAFDTTQITSAANFSNPQPGDPCHPLAAQAHVPAVVIPINDMATHHAGTDGSGNQNGKGHGLGIGGEFDPMFTLTKGDRHAVAHPIPINSMNALRSADADPSTGCGIGEAGEAMFTITKAHSHAVAFDWKMGAKARSIAINHEQAPTLGMQADRYAVQQAMQVRRLTPVECERLQGFPDNYTDIKAKGKPTPDGPRYKALGNSMAVPVMAWIGKRIQENLQNTAS